MVTLTELSLILERRASVYRQGERMRDMTNLMESIEEGIALKWKASQQVDVQIDQLRQRLQEITPPKSFPSAASASHREEDSEHMWSHGKDHPGLSRKRQRSGLMSGADTKLCDMCDTYRGEFAARTSSWKRPA